MFHGWCCYLRDQAIPESGVHAIVLGIVKQLDQHFYALQYEDGQLDFVPSCGISVMPIYPVDVETVKKTTGVLRLLKTNKVYKRPGEGSVSWD